MNPAFALCSVILFATLAILLFMAGDHQLRVTISVALLAGAIGQHLAQSPLVNIVIGSILLTYAAIAMAALAVIKFALS